MYPPLLFSHHYSAACVELARGQVRKLIAGQINQATARSELRVQLRSEGHLDPVDDEGADNPYSSEALDRVLRLSTLLVQSARRWQQGQDEGILDQWPAQELLWNGDAGKSESALRRRWREAGGKIREGRMLARKDAEVWEKMSLFGLPYGPFDLDGMADVEDVDRGEAEDLRLLKVDEVIRPSARDFEADFAAAEGTMTRIDE